MTSEDQSDIDPAFVDDKEYISAMVTSENVSIMSQREDSLKEDNGIDFFGAIGFLFTR